MADIGDFIRRSRRSAYKISKCATGFEKQQQQQQQQQKKKKKKKQKDNHIFLSLTGARRLQLQLSCKITRTHADSITIYLTFFRPLPVKT